MGKSFSGKPYKQLYGTPRIELAMVTRVNPETYSCDVHCEMSSRFISDISWSMPYTNNFSGEGFNFCPETGSQCWLMDSSEGDRFPAIIAFYLPPDNYGFYRGNRRSIRPGDMSILGRKNNEVSVLRNGAVIIKSKDLAQRMYIPTINMIRDIFENYEMVGVPGDIKWGVSRGYDDTDINLFGNKPCYYFAGYREKADDPEYIMTVEFANNKFEAMSGDVSDNAVSLKVFNTGKTIENVGRFDFSSGAGLSPDESPPALRKEVLSLNIKKDGSLSINSGDITVNAGNVDLKTEGKLLISSQEMVELKAQEDALLQGKSVKISSDSSFINIDDAGNVTINAPQGSVNINASVVNSGEGGDFVLLRSFLDYFFAHKHDPTTGEMIYPTRADVLNTISQTTKVK